MMQFKSFHWLSRHDKRSHKFGGVYIYSFVGFYVFREFFSPIALDEMAITNSHLTRARGRIGFGMIVLGRIYKKYLTESHALLI